MNSKTTGAEHEDSLFLERVLDKLYDFGSTPKQKLKGQKKKKKRKRCDEEEEEEEEFATVKDECRESGGDGGKETKLQEAQEEETGSGGTGVNQVQVVTFQDPRKKLKTKSAADGAPVAQIAERKQSDQQEALSLEKARLEVHRFGITGYRKEQQREFEQDRAVMLGARPPKKNYVNYKLLQEQIKEKKERAKEEVQPDLKKKKKKQRNQQDRKKGTATGAGTAPTGQVGRFKDGMLILSSKEIQQIKGRKGGRR